MTRSALLAEPDFHTAPAWSQTLGDEVADLCEMVGFPAYPEQRLILDDVFALDPGDPNRSAAFEAAAIACRQQLKTGLLKQCALGWLFITDQPLIIWSAHEFGTSQEAFRDMQVLIDASDYLRRRVRRVTTAAGNEAIELTSGARLKFKARTSGGGRGLTGYKVILDEAFALMPEHMGALLPTLIAVPDPQVLYGSSAGLAKSETLRDLRDRGRAGGPRLSYTEWLSERTECAIPQCTHKVGVVGCALDDERLWRQSCIVTARNYPAMDPIRALRQAMPPEEFMRECLGWWDDPLGEAAISAAIWQSLAESGSKITGQARCALDVAPGQASAAIAVAGARADGLMHVELSGRDGILDHHPGTAWVPARLADMGTRWPNFEVSIIAGSAAESLVPQIVEAGVAVDIVKAADVAPACGLLYNLAVSIPSGLRHIGQPELTTALANAARVDVGDSAWKWARRKSTADITPLYAVTAALWAANHAKPTPNVW